MHTTWSIGADSWEEVLRFEAVGDVFEFLAVACEEDGASSWAVAAADDIALDVGWAIGLWGEGLIIAAVSW